MSATFPTAKFIPKADKAEDQPVKEVADRSAQNEQHGKAENVRRVRAPKQDKGENRAFDKGENYEQSLVPLEQTEGSAVIMHAFYGKYPVDHRDAPAVEEMKNQIF